MKQRWLRWVTFGGLGLTLIFVLLQQVYADAIVGAALTVAALLVLWIGVLIALIGNELVQSREAANSDTITQSEDKPRDRDKKAAPRRKPNEPPPDGQLLLLEEHSYEVEIREEPLINARSASSVSVTLALPYDGMLVYDAKQQFKDLPTPTQALPLGTLTIETGERSTAKKFPVELPAGADWRKNLRCRRMYRLRHSEPIEPLEGTALTINARVFDGHFDDRDEEAIHKLVSGEGIDFDKDLRLEIDLWMPEEERSPERRKRELRSILIERESARQALLPSFNAEQLAERLLAMANLPSGGQVIIGVEPSGRVVGLRKTRIEQIKRELLKIALDTKPMIGIEPPDLFFTAEGLMIVRVKVLAGKSGPYVFKGTVYRWLPERSFEDELRKAWFTVWRWVATLIGRPSPALPPSARSKRFHVVSGPDLGREEQGSQTWSWLRRISFLNWPLTSTKNKRIDSARHDDRPQGGGIASLDSERVQDILRYPRGEYIIMRNRADVGKVVRALCALVNAGSPYRMVLFRHEGKEQSDLRKSWQDQLHTELNKCTPSGLQLSVEKYAINRDVWVVAQIAADGVPAVLYGDQSFDWVGRVVPMKIDELIWRYVQRMEVDEPHRQVPRIYGHLLWPVQPPDSAYFQRAINLDYLDYDHQRAVIDWKPRSMRYDSETGGWTCDLSVPLRNALLQIDPQGQVLVSPFPELSGELVIDFDGMLVSGTLARLDPNCDAKGNPRSCEWLGKVPIRGKTLVRIQYTIDAQALFPQRQRMSLLHVRIPDLVLSDDRRRDVMQIFADLGFRVIEPDRYEASEAYDAYEATGEDNTDRFVRIVVRSKGFYDIRAFIGMISKRIAIQREQIYGQRVDSKSLETAVLEVRVVFVSSSPMAAKEIASLHIKLHEMMHERLSYVYTM